MRTFYSISTHTKEIDITINFLQELENITKIKMLETKNNQSNLTKEGKEVLPILHYYYENMLDIKQ